MAEITMNDPDLREIASALRYLEGREDECTSNRRKWGEIAGAIEEQLTPATEDPEEFASVVRAGIDGLSDRVLWQRSASGYWFSETSRRAWWSDLHQPEVLRVGLGEKPWVLPVDAYKGGQEIGERAFAGKIRARLIQLLDEAITSERKNALEKAIQAVEELAP